MRATRYEVLDGLRGTAAMLVVALHLCGTFRLGAAANPLHHGYLAVDFFYMLSGFVIGHAYDRRWPQMGLGGFFARRLIRLHPLALLGAGEPLTGRLMVYDSLSGEARTVRVGADPECPVCGSTSPLPVSGERVG